MALKTVLNKIIVEPVEAETKTASGIIIPDSAKEKPQKGIVVATGKGKHDEPMVDIATPKKKTGGADGNQSGRCRSIR